MPPSLSMSTGFGLFRNSNLLTAHEHVANSCIDAFMYIRLLRICWMLETVRDRSLFRGRGGEGEYVGKMKISVRPPLRTIWIESDPPSLFNVYVMTPPPPTHISSYMLYKVIIEMHVTILC